MWLKWLGGLLILGTCVTLGRRQGNKLRKREMQLQGFLQLCHRIETEISYGQTPLPQIFQGCQALPFPVAAIAVETAGGLSAQTGDTLWVIWNGVLDKFAPFLCLDQADMEVVRAIGSELGLSYSSEQMKKLQLLTVRLKEQERLAHEERLKMEKVWQVLGWCSGSMLVLLFM